MESIHPEERYRLASYSEAIQTETSCPAIRAAELPGVSVTTTLPVYIARLDSLGWPSLEQRRKTSCLGVMYKIYCDNGLVHCPIIKTGQTSSR